MFRGRSAYEAAGGLTGAAEFYFGQDLGPLYASAEPGNVSSTIPEVATRGATVLTLWALLRSLA